MTRFFATAVTMALFALPALAQETPPEAPKAVATAAAVNGPVQVNQGEQFLPLRVDQNLKPGDRVMALRKGSALIRFDDGCDLRVEPETMIEVPDRSTCAGAVVEAHAIAPASSTAVGSTAAAQGVDWKGAALITGIVIVGDAILYNQDESEAQTISP